MRSMKPLLAFLLLPLLAGCAHVDKLRLAPDRPEDLAQLLEEHEFARARQLTAAWATIDTPELQTRITGLENDYEEAVLAEARQLAETQDLLGAVQLLSGALSRIPNSERLRRYRGQLEQERVRLLRLNERQLLLAHAQFLLRQQDLYRQQSRLESPGLEQRWQNSRIESEAVKLAKDLLEHAGYALQQDELDAARNCLELSRALNDTTAAGELQDRLQAAESLQRETTQEATRSRLARQQRDIQHHQDRETSTLLEKTSRAIDENDLAAARATFERIPTTNSNDSKVVAVQDKLDQAVGNRLAILIDKGDVQYRADNVVKAIEIWSQAQSLDPENPELRERLERANKVLARYEELKRRQK